MAKKSGNLAAMRGRAARATAGSAPQNAPTVAASEPRKRTSVTKFFEEVRTEMRRISWTSRKETWITTVMVFIMVVISSAFLFVIDWGLGSLVAQFLKLANAG
jgi:preprotein translocase subunit SecE